MLTNERKHRILTTKIYKNMKKLLLLKRVAMTLLIVLACSSQALARWVGNSAINVNGTWYYAGNSSMSWCSGGSFDGRLRAER